MIPDNQRTERKAIGRFHVKVGRFVAGGVERELRKAAFDADLTIHVERHVGWLDGYLLVRVEGDEATVRAYNAAIQKWLEDS